MPRLAVPRRRLVAVIALATAVAASTAGALDLVLTNSAVDAAQHRAAAQVERAWSAPPEQLSAAVPAGAIGLLRVPRFGADYVRVITAGTTDAVLDSGAIGHYAGTAMPGAIGNMALAGHREADGASMLHITALRPGDAIVVETRTRTYTYTVTGSRQVDPTDVAAIAAVPGHPHATPTGRLITLQSCTPPLIDTWRYVVWGRLVSTTER